MLIDIEGIDGSGKGTQARRLCERLDQEGKSASLISFPRYDETLFGRAIGEFLNGEYGTLEAVHPFLVSLLFAGDRLESKAHLMEAMRTSDVVVLDRYVPSNVAHQASKREGAERADLTKRILEIEFEINELPQPDLVFLLDLPVPVARKLVECKSPRSYTDRKADLQEADGAYLQRVRDVYIELSRTDPRWRRIDCCDANGLRAIDEINDELFEVVRSERIGGKDSWVEYWADDTLRPYPYVLLVAPTGEGGFVIVDPKQDNAVVHRAASYDSARMWLLEDEYSRVDGRISTFS